MNYNQVTFRVVVVSLLLFVMTTSLFSQKIAVSQPVVDCGQVAYRHPVAVQFEAKNKSGNPLTISDVRTSCGCVAVSFPREPVLNGKVFKITASYDARQMGHFEKQIAVYMKDSGTPVYLTMRGVVVDKVVDYTGEFPLRLGDIYADKTGIEFEDVNRGERPFHRINILNPTSKAMQPQVMHLPDYLQAQVSPSTIAPGKTGVVTLTLLSDRLRDLGLTQTSVYLGRYPGDRVSSDKEINVSVVLLPSFGELTARNLQQAPHIELSDTCLDLGSFNGKKKKRGEIVITNTGHRPLEISSIQMSAAGLNLSLSSRTIAPGSSARLRVTAVASVLRRSRVRPRVLMITNDPQTPKVTIAVSVGK